MDGIAAFYLVIIMCSSPPVRCAEMMAPVAPFHDEYACAEEGWRRTKLRAADYRGFAWVGYRCDLLPLER